MGTSTKGMRPAPMGAGYPAPGDPTGYSDRMSHAAADHPGMSARRLPAVEERSAGGVVVDVHEGEARIAVIARRNRAGRIELASAVEGVTKRFGTFEAVSHMDLEIADGEFFTMLGPSGCGKTTTLRMIAGFEQPTEGKVLIELGTIDYWFAAGERRIHKYVHHYLLEATGGHLTIENDPDHEAIDVAWLPLRDAHRHLTFPNERRIARLAWQRLSGDAASC